MPVKPETEIRKLKKEITNLRLLCQAAGVPLLAIYLPELVLKKYKSTITENDMKWLKEKLKEHKKLKKQWSRKK